MNKYDQIHEDVTLLIKKYIDAVEGEELAEILIIRGVYLCVRSLSTINAIMLCNRTVLNTLKSSIDMYDELEKEESNEDE